MKKHPYFNCMVTEDGQVFSMQGKKYSPFENEFGYLTVNLKDPEDGKWKKRKVHRIVAETYIENPEGKREVNHIDCDKKNNTLDNLEWVTSKENKAHGWANGLYTAIGENHADSVLTNEQVHEICRLMEEGARNIDLAKAYGVHKDTISHIRIGNLWKHISSNYDLKKKRVERKSPEFVIRVAELLELGWKDRKIAEQLNINPREVSRIRRREIHKTLTKDYDF